VPATSAARHETKSGFPLWGFQRWQQGCPTAGAYHTRIAFPNVAATLPDEDIETYNVRNLALPGAKDRSEKNCCEFSFPVTDDRA
jgi:hypothetical protein